MVPDRVSRGGPSSGSSRQRPVDAAAAAVLSCRAGHRGWNRQPPGIRVGSGISPVSTTGRSSLDPRHHRQQRLRVRVLWRLQHLSAGPASTIRPRYITAIRSAMFQARPRSWVTTSTPSPSSSRSFSSRARISPRMEASRLETGSSAISSSGPRPQRPCDQDPLPLAARQLVRVAQEQASPADAGRLTPIAAATSCASVRRSGSRDTMSWRRSPSATDS